MGELIRRLDRLERLIGAADCRCHGGENELRWVVVEPEWSAEQIRIADEAIEFDCPTHGLRHPRIVHLSPTDAML
jgi:hypothetical protein